MANKLLRSFIHGKYAQPCDRLAKYELKNPATSDVIHHFFPSNEQQVGEAISSSKEAQEKWHNEYSPAERGAILRRAADILSKKSKEISELETLDTGRPITETTTCDVVSATDCLYYYSGIAPSIGGTTYDMPGGSWAYTRREPLGITAGIGGKCSPATRHCWCPEYPLRTLILLSVAFF